MSEHIPDPNWFSSPGGSLLAAMHRRELSARTVASHLTGGIDQLRSYLAGTTPIDPIGANALSGVVGGSAAFWLRRQANYDLALERVAAALPDDEADIWLSSIPIPGPKPRGRLAGQARSIELRRRLAYFGVGSIAAWERRYGFDRETTRFRTSNVFASQHGAVALWLRQAEIEASLADTARWNPHTLKSKLPDIKKLSRIARPERFLPKLKELLAQSGVAFVALRTESECKASGASRLLRPDRAMIVASFRYRSDDQFWFTLFHEIGHLLLHGAHSFVEDEDMEITNFENEANEFARRLIVPADRWAEFEMLGSRHEAITRFAVSVGVSAGLILGQLQHAKQVSHERHTFLRRRWTWREIDDAIASL